MKNDFAFWTGFYESDCKNEAANEYDYFTWASNKAYSDMKRTLTFKDIPKNDSQKEKNRVDNNRKQLRDRGTAAIRAYMRCLSNDFRAWHEEVCDELIEKYGKDTLVIREGNIRTETPTRLTFGQAQKWLNMTLKYLWLLDRLGLISNSNDSAIIKKFQGQFHVPLDSYMLRYITKQDKSKKAPFSPENDNELNEACHFREFWDSFGSAWSQIDCADKDKYYDFQERLALAVGDKTPLEWELIHWHKALKYYG